MAERERGKKVAWRVLVVLIGVWTLYMALGLLSQFGIRVPGFDAIAEWAYGLGWREVDPSAMAYVSLAIGAILAATAILRIRAVRKARPIVEAEAEDERIRKVREARERLDRLLASADRMPPDRRAKLLAAKERLERMEADTPIANADSESVMADVDEFVSEAPIAEAERENGDLPPDRIEQIIARGSRRHRVAFAVVRALGLFGGLYVAWWGFTSTDQLVGFFVSLLFGIQILALLHTAYPAVAAMFWTGIIITVGFLYGVPYRSVRKRLDIVDGNREKTIGRVIFIKGCDEDGLPPRSILYTVWYAYRWLRRKKLEWPPHPHEIPFGDVNYLRGRNVSVEVPDPQTGKLGEKEIPLRFRWAILYHDNTDGLYARLRYPRWLWANATLESGLFVHKLVGGGFNMRRIPSDGRVPGHRELWGLDLMFHVRESGRYVSDMQAELEQAAGMVERGVQADALMSKKMVERFVFPSPEYLDWATKKKWAEGEAEQEEQVEVPPEDPADPADSAEDKED